MFIFVKNYNEARLLIVLRIFKQDPYNVEIYQSNHEKKFYIKTLIY